MDEQFVTPVGFEPTITRMKTWGPGPLDDGAIKYIKINSHMVLYGLFSHTSE